MGKSDEIVAFQIWGDFCSWGENSRDVTGAAFSARFHERNDRVAPSLHAPAFLKDNGSCERKYPFCLATYGKLRGVEYTNGEPAND